MILRSVLIVATTHKYINELWHTQHILYIVDISINCDTVYSILWIYQWIVTHTVYFIYYRYINALWHSIFMTAYACDCNALWHSISYILYIHECLVKPYIHCGLVMGLQCFVTPYIHCSPLQCIITQNIQKSIMTQCIQKWIMTQYIQKWIMTHCIQKWITTQCIRSPLQWIMTQCIHNILELWHTRYILCIIDESMNHDTIYALQSIRVTALHRDTGYIMYTSMYCDTVFSLRASPVTAMLRDSICSCDCNALWHSIQYIVYIHQRIVTLYIHCSLFVWLHCIVTEYTFHVKCTSMPCDSVYSLRSSHGTAMLCDAEYIICDIYNALRHGIFIASQSCDCNALWLHIFMWLQCFVTQKTLYVIYTSTHCDTVYSLRAIHVTAMRCDTVILCSPLQWITTQCIHCNLFVLLQCSVSRTAMNSFCRDSLQWTAKNYCSGLQRIIAVDCKELLSQCIHCSVSRNAPAVHLLFNKKLNDLEFLVWNNPQDNSKQHNTRLYTYKKVGVFFANCKQNTNRYCWKKSL